MLTKRDDSAEPDLAQRISGIVFDWRGKRSDYYIAFRVAREVLGAMEREITDVADDYMVRGESMKQYGAEACLDAVRALHAEVDGGAPMSVETHDGCAICRGIATGEWFVTRGPNHLCDDCMRKFLGRAAADSA